MLFKPKNALATPMQIIIPHDEVGGNIHWLLCSTWFNQEKVSNKKIREMYFREYFFWLYAVWFAISILNAC